MKDVANADDSPFTPSPPQLDTPSRPHALLLLGPTGSGKTPLGDLIAERGLWQARCVHFDFGAQLRLVAERNRPDELVGQADVDFLREVLETGALLEDEHFPLAERILRSFLAQAGADARTLVVLNGLPRHVGQAEATDAILDVNTVVRLRCPVETILARIASNVGGDRRGRADDDRASIRRKLALFAERTAPLADYYRAQGARIETIDVTAPMTPAEMWELLARRSQAGQGLP